MATLEQRVSDLEKEYVLVGKRLVDLYQLVDAGFNQTNERFDAMKTRFDNLEKLITQGFSKNGA